MKLSSRLCALLSYKFGGTVGQVLKGWVSRSRLAVVLVFPILGLKYQKKNVLMFLKVVIEYFVCGAKYQAIRELKKSIINLIYKDTSI